jgi:glycosyltransferase involved in cell wall biosynthesis
VRNWILDQHNADVHFWKVYATQSTSLLAKLIAFVNWGLAKSHFPKIYSRMGRIISVCAEDKYLTLQITPSAKVDVIENGVDCSFFFPVRNRPSRPNPFRLLFTGTSVPRNMSALHQFVRKIYPLVRKQLPACELLVAGNFTEKAQLEFRDVPGVRFTGKVNDIRPSFNKSDVYISPFKETHGSKLKISEAMSMAMPIVSTPEGTRGFALEHNSSVLHAGNDNEFAEQIVRLSKDSPLREKIGRNAREVALATISWDVLGDRLIKLVQEHQESL